MGEIAPKLKRNLKDRFENLKDTGKREVDVVKSSFKSLVELKPVPAVVDIVADTVDNVGDFVKYQSGVFRRWIE